MKKLVLFLLLVFTSHQLLTAQHKTFLRVFDPAGKKIAKGFLTGFTDSSITVERNHVPTTLSIKKIGTVRTRRSVGHTALVAGGVTAVVIGIFSVVAIKGDSFFDEISAGAAFATGFLAGGAAGSFIGAIAGGLKKSTAYSINGNSDTWHSLQPVLQQMLSPVNTNPGP